MEPLPAELVPSAQEHEPDSSEQDQDELALTAVTTLTQLTSLSMPVPPSSDASASSAFHEPQVAAQVITRGVHARTRARMHSHTKVYNTLMRTAQSDAR